MRRKGKEVRQGEEKKMKRKIKRKEEKGKRKER